ncbi:Subfamily M3A non-peptidase ue [Fasciolopsis buskii]|uniref:Subfamily M3A non-peptidase ue n=1 Tax=Fasciolopsis buskii TaxID=27845 RepID=A0A8E0VJA1_9TREM|nr:Subfamily M3A non-peptidase ue [Fasciolopsis buski]
MMRLFYSRHVLSHCARRLSIMQDPKYDHGPSFYVIPEIPKETCLLQKLECIDMLPNFSVISPDLAFTGFSRLLIDHQLSLSKLSEQLKKNDGSVSGPALLTRLKEILQPVEKVFEALNSITLYDNDPMWSLINGRLFQKLIASRTEYFCLDPDIYRALLKLSQDSAGLDEADRGKCILKSLVYECWRQGADSTLKGSGVHGTKHLHSPSPDPGSVEANRTELDRIRAVRRHLSHEEEQFQAMVFACSSVTGPLVLRSRFSGRTPDPSDLTVMTGAANIPIAESDLAPSTPSWLPSALGGRISGGHVADMRVNLSSDSVVRAVLKHCGTRQVRHTVWYGWVQRSSLQSFGGSAGQHASNDGRMQDIRRARHRLANLLGCKDWLEVVWRATHLCSQPSANSLIENYLEPLRDILQPMGKQELQVLSEWASSNLEFRGSKLDPWDMDYVIEQYNYAATYSQFQAQLLPTSGSLLDYIGSLLDELANLFQLRVVPDPGAMDPGRDDVLRLRIEDSRSNAVMGYVILDLFARFLPLCLGQEQRLHSHLVTLCSVFSLLHFKQYLLSIASGFGACLQRLLSRTYHHQLSRISAFIVPDTDYLVPDLCSALMFASVIRPRLGSNAKESKSRQSYADPALGVRPPSGRIFVLPLLRQLYETRFDLALWSHEDRNKNWVVLNEEFWSSHLPYPRHPNDCWPCSATQLFGPNGRCGLQYQEVWRQILLHDVLAQLKKLGWPDQSDTVAVQEVLERLRKVFMLNNDLPPNELFQSFCGRDPSPEPLIQAIRTRAFLAPSAIPIPSDVTPNLVHE